MQEQSAREIVLSKYPDAWCFRLGPLLYEIRRPMPKGGLVKYQIISKLFSEPKKAWENAAEKIHEANS